MKRAYLVGAALWVAAGVEVMACGGRAALEAYELESASGSGGSSSGTSSTSSGTGGTTTTTSTSSTSTSTSSTGTSTSTSSSGSGMCDLTGDCQYCLDCAMDWPCSAAMDACFSSPQCDQFMSCIEQCPGPGGPCFNQCAQQFPAGADLYIGFLDCAFCIECPVDCVNQTPPWLCFDDENQ